MFIAHLPAGYLATRGILKILKICRPKYLLGLGLLASLLPDFDLIYFYTVDRRQHLHHGYWTHLPAFWFALSCFALFGCCIFRKLKAALYVAVFSLNIFLHLFLDTVAGQIKWLYPFSDRYFYCFEVPARFGPSMWNFIFHWSFLLELGLLLFALILLWKSRNPHLPSGFKTRVCP
jgi:Predicted membrane-bound metal-dependent hydrolase (DUF457).